VGIFDIAPYGIAYASWWAGLAFLSLQALQALSQLLLAASWCLQGSPTHWLACLQVIWLQTIATNLLLVWTTLTVSLCLKTAVPLKPPTEEALQAPGPVDHSMSSVLWLVHTHSITHGSLAL